MSFHILHLLSPGLRVRLTLDQLSIEDPEKGEVRTVPIEDISVVISAAPDFTITAGALRRMAERNVLLMVCNQKFEPVSITVPHFCPTSTETLRKQVAWTLEWKEALWRQIIAAKILRQSLVIASHPATQELLRFIADKCLNPPVDAAPALALNTAQMTASKRDQVRRWHAAACESRAARIYWRKLLPMLCPRITLREPGTRAGVNGMLDYGYAVMRAAVLRSLAAHGLIAALGLHHKSRAGSFALADDLMEPLRPFADSNLMRHLTSGGRIGDMKGWAPRAAGLLATEVRMGQTQMRLLNAIDAYIQSFLETSNRGINRPLQFPELDPM